MLNSSPLYIFTNFSIYIIYLDSSYLVSSVNNFFNLLFINLITSSFLIIFGINKIPKVITVPTGLASCSNDDAKTGAAPADAPAAAPAAPAAAAALTAAMVAIKAAAPPVIGLVYALLTLI